MLCPFAVLHQIAIPQPCPHDEIGYRLLVDEGRTDHYDRVGLALCVQPDGKQSGVPIWRVSVLIH